MTNCLEKNRLSKGAFWLIDGELVCIKTACDTQGNPTKDVSFSSKSGENFNHAAEWAKLPRAITHGMPFNYYPRGRVEVKNEKAVIYLNPSINRYEIQDELRERFGLDILSKVSVKNDGSEHYRALSENE